LSIFPRSLLLVEKSDRSRVQTVVCANHAEFAGINFSLENRRGRTQRLHDVVNVRLYRCFEITFRRGLDRGLDSCHQRLDMTGRCTFGSDSFSGRFHGAATLMSKHHDEADRHNIDRILDASQAFVVDHVPCDPQDE
jgi:hypothetical protein